MDLFKFPFPVEIWGSVSDWVMIGVTAATAYLLFSTLKSQKEVQETQNQLLKIEQLRLREDFRPNLKYARFLSPIGINEPNKILVCIAIKNISSNAALNVKCSIKNILGDEGIKEIMFKPNPRTLTNDDKAIELYFLVDDKAEDQLICQIFFGVEFEDVASTKYSQIVLFDSFAGIEEFKIFDTQIVSKV